MEDILDRLHRYMKIGSPAERKIARYFSEHLEELPFETAASIAAKLDLSPMTVGRFLRALGYQGLDSIKVEMRGIPMATGPADIAAATVEPTAIGEIVLQQIEAVRSINDIAGTPDWTEAADAVVSARQVFILSHRRVASPVRRFHERLNGIRADVYRLDTPEDFAALLARADAAGCLLVLIDCRHFHQAPALLKTARASGYRVLLINWAQSEQPLDRADITLGLSPSRAESDHNLAVLAVMLECLATQIGVNAGRAAARWQAHVSAIEALLAGTTSS